MNKRHRWNWWLSALTLFGLAALQSVQATEKECALVLMHGKWGSTQYMAAWGRKLEPVCTVKTLEMPWSQSRYYDAPYPVALDEVARQVQAFRAEGYRRVLVGGQSFGANASLAYMASKGDADGVLALSPGHSPRAMFMQGMNTSELKQAREWTESGQGQQTVSVVDLNQGQRRSIRMSAEVFWSYFNPQGLGDMTTSARAFQKAVPLMMVVGQLDSIVSYAETGIFKQAPSHPYSRYLLVQGDHGSAPEVATAQVVDWLRQLP